MARPLAAVIVLVALIGSLVVSARPSDAQGQLVINELVAANTTRLDSFGETSDWIELRNTGSSISLAGWTIADGETVWPLPDRTMSSGERLVIWASGRDATFPDLHANFKLSASAGETIRLSDPDGGLVDATTFPPIGQDQAWGRDESTGQIGFLRSPTFGTANSGLAPDSVVFGSAPSAFVNSMSLVLTANLNGSQQIRYTTNGSPVTSSSAVYSGPLVLSASTVVRAAVVDGSFVGPEASGGYVRVSADIENFSSNLPIVLVQMQGPLSQSDAPAVVTVLDTGADGRARVLDTPAYNGFAGLRIRGDSSTSFPKKQYKFELWDSPNGDSTDADLLGLGADDDWNLYAPGRMDRAFVQNPFMYELGHQIGVPAPDSRFVEVYLESDTGQIIGADNYQGIYLLRETIEIDDQRVDITEPTSSTSGPDTGFIIRADRPDSCCTTIQDVWPAGASTAVVAVNDPGADEITSSQLAWVDSWWDDLSASTTSWSAAQPYFDWDALIDHWLLVILNGDPDGLRLSQYWHREANGGLRGGPLWDYDRTLGSADTRNDELAEATGWGATGFDLRTHAWYGNLWAHPEVQARMKARWNELRAGPLSNTALDQLIFSLGNPLTTEAYARENNRWGSTSGYGSRFSGGLSGELSYMSQFVQTRADWIDSQWSSSTRPSITNPVTINGAEGQPLDFQFQITGTGPYAWTHSDLPAGLTLDQNGRLSGTVAYGDGATMTLSVTATDRNGGFDEDTMTIAIAPAFSGEPQMMLNEYNAVDPGALLDLNGADTTFGRVAGNGGDWFEVVTLADSLDLRGWTFESWSNTDDGVRLDAALTVSTATPVPNLLPGSIVTIAESVPTDLSYNPGAGDWTINLQLSGFDTNNRKWRLVVRDPAGTIRAPVAGETEPWDDANLGVNGREVMALTATPGPAVNLITDYTDRTASTFGSPNTGQSLESIRGFVSELGDVDCSGTRSLLDARLVAQFAIGARSSTTVCPLPSPGTELYGPQADVDNSGSISLIDARLIAQCSIGATNTLCP